MPMKHDGISKMEKAKLKELIVGHKEKFLSRGGLIRRELQDEIANYIPQREILIITGVRRSGKSSLMKLVCDDLLSREDVLENNILYLNFEDERFVPFTVQDFEPLYETFIEMENPQGRIYLFLDEIQNISGWEKWLNRLYEFENVKIFVTGSNASLLSSEISTALTGRNRQIVTWPFSLREFLTLKGVIIDAKSLYKRQKKVEIKRLFREYLELGGFPEVLKIGDTTLLEQYYKDIIYRDVITRYGIKNIKEIKELTLFLAANPGTVQSYKSMQRIIGVRSQNTVKNYLEALNDVYLFFFMNLFDYSLKRQIYNPSKFYCIDAALSSSISFKFSRNMGHIYENIVFLELLRRNKELFYWKSKKGREVDFIIKEGLHITEAIQVCYSLEDERTRQREIEALIEVKDELKAERLTVITDDEESTVPVELQHVHGQINIIPLWKWLL
ncbi:MAG TPA: ATP-binding protein [Candidatus Aminicenantes bacterium]|nr:ATP-binding protein [Candidatus Aminicenantes bacterium]